MNGVNTVSILVEPSCAAINEIPTVLHACISLIKPLALRLNAANSGVVTGAVVAVDKLFPSPGLGDAVAETIWG